MKLNALMKVTLLFSVFVVMLSLLLVHAFTTGLLSPRALGIVLLVFAVGSAGLFLRALSKLDKRSALQSGDAGTLAQRRSVQIRAAKVAIAVLVLLLVNGLFQLRSGPLLPLLVGITINVLSTITLVRIVIRLQENHKNDGPTRLT